MKIIWLAASCMCISCLNDPSTDQSADQLIDAGSNVFLDAVNKETNMNDSSMLVMDSSVDQINDTLMNTIDSLNSSVDVATQDSSLQNVDTIDGSLCPPEGSTTLCVIDLCYVDYSRQCIANYYSCLSTAYQCDVYAHCSFVCYANYYTDSLSCVGSDLDATAACASHDIAICSALSACVADCPDQP